MEELFHAYLRSGLWGSVIIVLVLLLRLCLKKAPRQLVCILWILVAARLVLPFVLESPLSLQPELPEFSDTAIQAPVLPPVDRPVIPPVAPPVSQPEQNDAPVPKPPKTVTLRQALPAIWLCGAGLAAAYGIASYLLLKRRLREAVKEEECYISDRIKGAFVMGYRNPRICLPAHTEIQDRPHIVAHEQAHIARGDHWWKLLGFVCLCLHWYNPLVWLSFVLFGRDTEVACDERVVWGMALEERKAYSLALLNCGRKMSGLTALTLCFGKESLKQRIKNVLSFRKPGIWITALAGMLAVAIAIFFLTSPKKPDPKPADPVDSTTVPTTQAPTDGTTVPPTTQTPGTVPTDPGTTPSDPTTVPPTTAPVETVPPTTAPPETEPPTTAPPTTQPPATEPPVTEPPATEPPATEPPTVMYSGSCGENVQWVLQNGILTISGSGDITSSPWLEYRGEIFEIIIREGVTSIPEGAFAECSNLLYVTVEPGLSYVGTGAFTGYKRLLMYWHGSAPEFARNWKSDNYAFIHYPEGDETWSEARKHNYVINTDYTPVSYSLSGFCGDNLAYYIDGTVMTICGTGDMDDYSTRELPPWIAFDHFITKLIIEDGVTGIGANAFSQFDSITELVLPNSVTCIRSMGFKDCTNLRTVTLSENLTHIWDFAFDSCVSLQEIKIPKSVTHFYSDALASCTGLKRIYFYGDPPKYAGCIYGVTVTAYYPADNANWTEEARERFGDGVTWVAM